MNICILQDYLRNGGTERQSILLAREFIAAGHPTTLVRFRPGGALEKTLGEVPSAVLQPFDCRLACFAPGLVRRLRALSPDVILCMGREANRRGARLRRAFPDTVIVATLRTGKALPADFRRSLSTADRVVANSEASARRLREEFTLPADRVAVIKNALVFPPAQGDRNLALREQFGAGAGTVVLLCAGMFRPEKNQAALLRAATRLPRDADWQLWLAGDGPSLTGCRALAAKLGLDDRVRFLGFQSALSPVYRAADVAVLTSRSESLSNFLIEAQAHGLPAVAYAATGVDECIEDGVTGRVVAMDDERALLEALGALIADPVLRERQARHAAAFGCTAFQPEARAADYLRLFALLRPTRPGHLSLNK
ncbi:MAG: glycosyltransferase [Verrucomicrobiota bacterium]